MPGNDVVTDAVVAGSASGELEDSIRASKRKKKKRKTAFESPTADGICSNCETKLSGPVCHSCGQTADNYHRPVWELVLEVLDGLLGVEGRLWRTLPPLMLQPGKLTRQYLSGVRARYVMPFRLYLTASVIFFLFFSFAGSMFNGASVEPLSEEDRAALGETLGELGEEVEAAGGIEGVLAEAGMSEEQQQRIAQYLEQSGEQGQALIEELQSDPEAFARRQNAWRDEAKLGIRQALLPEDYPELEIATNDDPSVVELEEGMSVSVGDVSGLPYEWRKTMADRVDGIINSNGQTLYAEMWTWAPRLMFVLLPIYALMLGFTHFYKRGYFFYDHLVVSLHFHAFLFFFFVVLAIFGALVDTALAFLIFLVWSNYYLYRIHRHVYRHGRFSSFLRTIFMDFIHSIVLAFGMLVLLVLSLMTAAPATSAM